MDDRALPPRDATVAVVGRRRRVRGHAVTFSRFALVGSAKTAVDFTVFNLVLLLTVSPHPARLVVAANTLAFFTATVASFPVMARFAFRRQARRNGLLVYVLVSIAGLVAYDAAVASQLWLLHAHGVLALNGIKVTSLGASLLVNYSGYHGLVFLRPRAAEEPQ